MKDVYKVPLELADFECGTDEKLLKLISTPIDHKNIAYSTYSL